MLTSSCILALKNSIFCLDCDISFSNSSTSLSA
uniref:Epidermal growth factor receptor substrate 15-like 1 n=1 Tax=Rhizophora mucronata TaxID=61149 RepID=A0A2P2MCX6_RHIMU